MNELSLPIRWIVVLLLVVAGLTFFFPLVSIHIPIAGDQEWSGYDLLARMKDVDRSLVPVRRTGKQTQSFGETGDAESSPTESGGPVPAGTETMPSSIRALPLIPVEIGLAFVAAALAFLLNLSRNAARAVTFLSLLGGIAAVISILHIVIANSDLHELLRQQINLISQSGDDNSFAGLANSLAGMAVNAFQLRPGVGLYALGGALLCAAILAGAMVEKSTTDGSEGESSASWTIVPRD